VERGVKDGGARNFDEEVDLKKRGGEIEQGKEGRGLRLQW